MSQSSPHVDPHALPEVHYPESDGKPMADNTLQYRWMTLIKENLDRAHPEAFVAANLIWYPVRGRNDLWRAPDVLVALGRPKGERGSYRQWEEGGVAPQVVFEIWSPGNTPADAVDKHAFYERHGAEEYYLYNPHDGYLAGWVRHQGALVEQTAMAGHRSPRLGFRFVVDEGGLHLEHADGRPFLSYDEIATLLDQQRARADQAEQRAAALAAKLRALGIEPDEV